jgi:hypothetical protein
MVAVAWPLEARLLGASLPAEFLGRQTGTIRDEVVHWFDAMLWSQAATVTCVSPSQKPGAHTFVDAGVYNRAGQRRSSSPRVFRWLFLGRFALRQSLPPVHLVSASMRYSRLAGREFSS